MKKKINAYLLAGLMLILFGTVSCTDYLDRAPQSIISGTDAFKNFKNFQGYTEEMYNLIPDVAKHNWVASFNWGDDEIVSLFDKRPTGIHIDNGDYRTPITNGQCFLLRNWSATGGRHDKDIWGSAWYCIRKCNMGLEAIKEGLFVDASPEERNLIEGQLYFFRGWWYFQLIQYWGGMPYIDRVLTASDKLTFPRLSYQECADKIGIDLRKAADLLPIRWDDTAPGRNTMGQNQLRANKIWALGYLGKNYLWAGSPLMENGTTGPKTYNTEYCKKAAAAFAELLELVESGKTDYSLVDFENYSQLFFTIRQGWTMPGSTEAIMRSPSYEANSRWRQNQSYLPAPMCDGDNVTLSPTANYVNYFGMQNGLPLNDPDSKFNPQQPWKDRDPRFYTNFVYDGIKVVKGTTSMSPSEKAAWTNANLYTGGSYVDPNSDKAMSRTGYCLRKFITLGCNIWDDDGGYGAQQHIHLTWMRLADVYLMYAEAAAQAYNSPTGKDTRIELTAVGAVNKIRERAGVDPLHSKYIGTIDAFMSELRRERAVELAFEAHRFNDLRRWLLLTEYPYTIKTRQDFDRFGTLNTEKPTENEVRNFRETVIFERKFDSKHYWMPIADIQAHLYEGFPQNPGW